MMKRIDLIKLACVLAAPGMSAAAESPPMDFSGVGWVQYGQIVNSSDTARNNYNGDAMQNSGAQMSVTAKITERITGSVGLGVLESHELAGQLTGGGRTPISANPYIAEARFTYAAGDTAHPWLQVTGGLFHYNYNPDIKDLGLYLLRGPVYPGLLISGFETKDVLPIANVLGLWARHAGTRFTHDLILQSETDVKPYFDLSLAYIAQARVSSFFSVGAGVNFYRLIPSDSKVSHHPFNPVYETQEDHVANPYQREFIYVDSSGGKRDTSYLGFDGTKLMVDFAFDPKPLLGSPGIFGPEDLKWYGEAALMGLSFDKAHEALYGPIAERVPVMMGFNLPAFGFLDLLSFEAEWYGARFRDDLERLEPHQDDPTSPIPVTLSDTLRAVHGDDWKWALHAAKTIQGHFKISAQVANDHFRPGGTVHFPSIPSTYETATTASEDWYWMAKIVYFF